MYINLLGSRKNFLLLTGDEQLAYAKSQVEWAKKSKQQWEEARVEVDKIDDR